MNDRRPVGDDGIVEQLERRATRATLSRERREAILSAVSSRAGERRVGTPWSGVWARLAAALVVIVLAGVTVLAGLGGAPASRVPPAQGTTSGAASAPTSSATQPATGPLVPLSADALLDLVGKEAWIDGVVIADVTIEPLTDPPLVDCWVCPIGEIDGVTVLAEGADIERLADEQARRGVIAFRIRADTLESLGPVTPWTEQLAWPVESAATAGLTSGSAGGLVVVEGWLVTADQAFANCGPHVDRPLPTGEIEARFGCYANTWITEEETQPLSRREIGFSLVLPERAVTVQRRAYWEHALEARLDDEGLAIPRGSAYLLELLVDEWDGCEAGWGCRGWQVVARLDPVLPVLDSLVIRAESALPDTDLPLEDALSLVSTARKWLIPHPGPDGAPGLGDRPLAASWVQRSGDRARVQFRDLGDGRTIMTLLKLEAGRPVALVDVGTSDPNTAVLLSAWERDQAVSIALPEPPHWGIERPWAGIPSGVACPEKEGICASVPILTDDGLDPGSHFADVIVDIGREVIVAEVRTPSR